MRLRGLFEGICVLCSLCLLMEFDWIPSNRHSRTRWNQSTQSNWQKKLRSKGDVAKSNLHVTLKRHNIRKSDEDHRLSVGGAQLRPSCIWAGPAMGGFGSQPKTSGATRRLDALVASPMFSWTAGRRRVRRLTARAWWIRSMGMQWVRRCYFR